MNFLRAGVLLVAALFYFFATSQAHAANIYWDGGTSTAWNTGSNWTGGVAPGVNDVAVFNSGSGELAPNDPTINTTITIQAISIHPGYTQTITQGNGNDITLTAAAGFTMSGAAVFVGGNGASDMTTTRFLQAAGTFTAPGGFTDISTSVSILGGTFTHNSGTVRLIGTADQAVNFGGKVLNALTINNTGGGTSDDIVIAADSQVLLSGSLVITLGNLDMATNTEPLVIENHMTVADTAQATFTTNSNWTIGGNFTVNDAGSITVTAGTLTLNGTGGDQGIDLDGQAIFNLTINNTTGGTDDDIVIYGGNLDVNGALVITNGGLDLDTNTLALDLDGNMTLANDADASFTGATLALSGSLTVGDSATFTHLTGTVTLDGGAQAITGDVAFNNLSKEVSTANTLTFGVGDTVTVNGTATLQGADGQLLSLVSSSPGTQWKVSIPGSRSISYVSVTDSNATHATEISCLNGCTNGGGNTNWRFTAATSTTSSSSSASGGGGGGGGGSRRAVTNSSTTSNTSDDESNQNAENEASSNPAGLPEAGGKLSLSVEGETVTFTDVPVNQWFASYIMDVIEAGVAGGYEDKNGDPLGKFGPENSVTYAEILKMALEAAGMDVSDVTGSPANKSAQGTWSEKYVRLAEDMGLSLLDGSLNVNSNATRGAVAQIIVEALELDLVDANSEFSDVPTMHTHAQAIATLHAMGVISGDTDGAGNPTGTFRPDATINRAEVAKIMSIILEKGL